VRIDPGDFNEINRSAVKSPRYVIEVATDFLSTSFWYVTSHADCYLPSGLTNSSPNVYSGLISKISGTTQRIDPINASSTIGAIEITLTDSDGLTSRLQSLEGTYVDAAEGLKGRRVRIYMGFSEALFWEDYVLVATQVIASISYGEGQWAFSLSDIQRAMRTEIFDVAVTKLAATIMRDDRPTTVRVANTNQFTMYEQTAEFDDVIPSVGYFRIGDEIFRYTGKSNTTFTGVIRGMFGSVTQDHKVDTGKEAPDVTEFVHLQMPAPKLLYALLTGDLIGQPGKRLPEKWHMGINQAYIDYARLLSVSILAGWMNPDALDNRRANVYVRFQGLEKTDGKTFIEREILLLLGGFLVVSNDGSLRLTKMSNISASSEYVGVLNETNVVKAGTVVFDYQKIINNIRIQWAYDVVFKRFLKTNVLLDATSIGHHGKSNVKDLSFRGLYGTRSEEHTSELQSR
jgi:hypothetical protein